MLGNANENEKEWPIISVEVFQKTERLKDDAFSLPLKTF